MNRELTSFKRSDVPSELLRGPCFFEITKRALFDYSIVIASWFAMYHLPYYTYPIWVIIIAGRFHAFGVLIHELSHMNPIKKNWKFRTLEIMLGYPLGTTINAMAYHHLKHHRNTLMDNDPYFNINKKCSPLGRLWLTFKKGPLFVPFWITRSLVGSLAFFIPSLRNFYVRTFLQEVSKEDLTNDEEVIRNLKEEFPLLFFHITLAYLATLFPFMIYAYYIVLPVAGTFCIYRLLIEHEYDVVDSRSVYTMIESTFDHHLSWYEKLILGPHNIGYHCIHHIHPNAGLHHLPKIRDWYLQNCYKYGEAYGRTNEQ
ncbi:fatty acid desaturase [Bacteriovoracaceae bacterium]|nr:fatty acid desaturase [Bacteriovoracaceae bacterium]